MRVLAVCGAVELVSQSIKGTGTATTSQFAVPMPMVVDLAADFDDLSFAVATETHVALTTSGIHVETNSTTTMILKPDGSSLKMHNHVHSVTLVKTDPPQPPRVQEVCSTFSLPHARAPTEAAECLRKLAAAAKPDPARADKEHGWDAYDMLMTVATHGATSSMDSTIFLDKEDLLHHLVGDQIITGLPNNQTMKTHVDMNMTPTKGKPDSSHFAVPAAWTCTEAPMPPPPPSMKPFLECLQAPAPAIVV